MYRCVPLRRFGAKMHAFIQSWARQEMEGGGAKNVPHPSEGRKVEILLTNR